MTSADYKTSEDRAKALHNWFCGQMRVTIAWNMEWLRRWTEWMASRSEHGVHVTRLLWLQLRGASGRVDMLMRRLSPRDLVFAAALAVPLQTVPNAVRLAPLLIISGGERAATSVAPVALITVSSSLGPSPIDTLALRPDGHQHEQQPRRNGRGSWRRHFPDDFRFRKKSEPFEVVLGTAPLRIIYTL